MSENTKDTVLVVDDTKSNVDLLVEILGDLYDLRVAMNGETALEIMAEDAPDLVLLDIMMPEMDGYEVCRLMKTEEKTKEIPVIFVTALEQQEKETQGLELGAVDYITKPFHPDIVKLRVENHLKLVRANKALRHQNEILKENDRLRNDVEHIARHDLKTPMNTLMCIPQLLLKEEGLEDRHREMLEMISQSGYRVMDIINSSVDLYKMERGEYRLRPVPVDLVQILKQLKGEIHYSMEKKNITFRVLLGSQPVGDEDTFIVYGEEMLFYTLLANLVKNAVEASPENRAVTVGMDVKKDVPVVIINNAGMIPEQIRQSFFDKYVTWGKENGTGLGTYSAKLIAKTLGGRLAFHTDAETGTTLILELRHNMKADAVDEAFDKFFEFSPLQLGHLPRKRSMVIMVIDDYAIMRGTIISILKQMGFKEFIRVSDGMEGLQLLQVKQVDLIISDLYMPKLNGLQLLRQVKRSETLKHIPFIMISGESEARKVKITAKLGIDGFVVKPFTADILMRKVAQVLMRDRLKGGFHG